jgi:hypothetical protein
LSQFCDEIAIGVFLKKHSDPILIGRKKTIPEERQAGINVSPGFSEYIEMILELLNTECSKFRRVMSGGENDNYHKYCHNKYKKKYLKLKRSIEQYHNK